MLLIPEIQTDNQLVEKLMQKELMPKIMIVDDDIELLDELNEILSYSNYDVEVTSDSSSAFNIACELKPDLVILDLKMKTKNGFQLADELHHSFKTKNIPLIAITGFFTQQEHMVMTKLCGIKTTLLKPIDPQSLLVKIASVLEETKSDPDQDAPTASHSTYDAGSAEQERGNIGFS